MAILKQPKGINFTPEKKVEVHFHDHDETWVVTKGSCKCYMIDREGNRSEFVLEAGDIWMVEAGIEHGCDPLEGGCTIIPVRGSVPLGSHKPGHYHMEKEHYMPTMVVYKTPIDRYKNAEAKA